MVSQVIALLWLASGLLAVALIILGIVIRHGFVLAQLHWEINSRMSKLLEVTAELAHFEGRDQERAAEAMRQIEAKKVGE